MVNKDNEENIEEEKPTIFKKVIVVTLAILLILLVVTFFLSYEIHGILESLIESSVLQDNYTVTFDGIKVVFNKEVYKELNDIYLNNQANEFKVCLKGNYSNETYFINSLYTPETYKKEFSEVISAPCENSLIDLHSHPFKRCLPSEQDLISFEKFKEENKNALLSVMCEQRRFYFYR